MNYGSVRRVAIVGASRIPFARSNTAYGSLSNITMLTDTLRGVVQKYRLQGLRLGEVVGGAVMKHSRDWNLLRECVLGSGLDPQTPAYDIQQACGTGLEAAILVANKIALGQIECGIACGTDTTSDAPIAVNRRLQRGLMKLNAARTRGDKLKAAFHLLNPRYLVPELPLNSEPRTGKSMGQHAQLTADRYGITREAQDELSLASHSNLAKAYEEGFFDDLIMPYHGLTRDNVLRGGTSLAQLSKLAPAFDRQHGTITAGNASPLTDGASAVLLASEKWANEHGLPIMAYLSAAEVAAVDFVDEREGLLMAGAYAVPRMLQKLDLSLQEFDFYEIHEAFASVVLCTLAAWESEDFCRSRLGLDSALGGINRAKLNVKGGSVATGHPFAATGCRIVATLAKTLDQAGGGRGLISICAAGGQGVTAILEK
ncbi:acetyl-CoA C-acetyltransferase [Duganella sp. CF402]|uniref:acetyl-CoA C-acetyltransferase n=1 Tax=unclassified Duganella TaxID=2636909 RepID=UPI0008CF21B9|nr:MULTISPECIES: acetyl-CoA C-acetyltransferase [unclassified Duganella]RZT08189.1 3-ketoacyl-CoA thiolase [Duganella sp. BK701]SEM02711.1 acetyl-CoA C-acetyltransferase [Duganella sp. CF402]